MMIFPDIYLLSGFPFQLHQNVYGIDFPEENRMVLIDTGLDETDRRQIQETMKIWAFDWIGMILICFILPAVLTLLIAVPFRKNGWIKENDLKLDL